MLPPLPLPRLVEAPKRNPACTKGDGFVQVLLDKANDAEARILMAFEGVQFAEGSLLPLSGILTITVSPVGKCRYCWRA